MNTPEKRGRPKADINPVYVYRMARLGMPVSEIADVLGVHRNTIKYNFSQELVKGEAMLKKMLRRAQIRNALKGNAALQIFLGKNKLGQSDNPTPMEDPEEPEYKQPEFEDPNKPEAE